jgi:hypothetical protein
MLKHACRCAQKVDEKHGLGDDEDEDKDEPADRWIIGTNL